VLTDDMDGQARIGIFDVGADEFSAASIVRKPLESNDVGPSWLAPPIDPPGGGGCFATGCAIQAEDFTAILDPNSDGRVWTTLSVAAALGGEVLVAPDGDRINLPADTHDTIATYDLTFAQAGTYRAYYRARGFNSSSDSIYVPDAFGTDPDTTENLSDNGNFRWEVGDSFTILPSHVGMPLEFRIGRREQAAELDALVLNLDASLSAAELDALFDIIYDPADFNEDGWVDTADLLAWQAGFGITSMATRADGDADADGDVDGADFVAWQRQFTGVAATGGLSVQVPEPTSGALFGLSWLAVILGSDLSRTRRFRGTRTGYLSPTPEYLERRST
jgi:hypothetical protein